MEKESKKSYRVEKLTASPIPKPIAKEKIQESNSPQPKPLTPTESTPRK